MRTRVTCVCTCMHVDSVSVANSKPPKILSGRLLVGSYENLEDFDETVAGVEASTFGLSLFAFNNTCYVGSQPNREKDGGFYNMGRRWNFSVRADLGQIVTNPHDSEKKRK